MLNNKFLEIGDNSKYNMFNSQQDMETYIGVVAAYIAEFQEFNDIPRNKKSSLAYLKSIRKNIVKE